MPMIMRGVGALMPMTRIKGGDGATVGIRTLANGLTGVVGIHSFLAQAVCGVLVTIVAMILT